MPSMTRRERGFPMLVTATTSLARTRVCDTYPGEIFAGVRGCSTWSRCVVRMRDDDIELLPVGPTTDDVTGLELAVRGPTQAPRFKTLLTRTEIPLIARCLTELLEHALACDGRLDLTPIGFLNSE